MFIEFGILNPKLLFLLLFSITISAEAYLPNLFSSSYPLSILYDIFKNSISFLTGGLIYLLVLYRPKTSKKILFLLLKIEDLLFIKLSKSKKKRKKRKKEKKKYLYFY